MPITTLDLFAGAGGLTQGLWEASSDFKAVRAIEIDEDAVATYNENHGDGLAAAVDIHDWLASDEPDALDVDVIVGGPPCQGFSMLGKRDVNDERNRLWEEYARVILRTSPKYFVVENVAAFLRTPQLREFEKWTRPEGHLRDWTFEATVLNAADFGAPQVRRRAVLIGRHRDLPSPGLPQQTHSRGGSLVHEPHRTVLNAFSGDTLGKGIPNRTAPLWPGDVRDSDGPFRTCELHVDRNYQPISLQRFAAIPPGGSRFDLPDELLTPCWRKHRTGSGDVMGRLRWHEPAVTIRTEFFKPEKGRYLHPEEDRAITHWEAARLQGFDDDYQWIGSRTSIARQIGNAVPIPLGIAIGRLLHDALTGEPTGRKSA